jgi:uncharacterized delta-60 repeat protein
MKKLLISLFCIYCFQSSFSQNFAIPGTYLAMTASSRGKVLAVGLASGGYMITSIPSLSTGWSKVDAVAWQGEKFIVVGSKVARFHPDGTPDASFGTGGVVTGLSGTDLEVLCDGKILVAGSGIVRLMPNGAPDPSFGTNGQATAPFSIINMALAPDGKIYVIGEKNIARFMPDGVPDPSFMQGPLPAGDVEFAEIAIQADGNPVVTGTYNFNSPNADIALFRFRLNGALDPSFSGDGWLTLDMAQRFDEGVDVSLQSDGKIVVLGTGLLFQCPCPAVGNYAYVVARYNSDGTLDTSFGQPTTLPIYSLTPPYSLSFPGMGKTVNGSFFKATALKLYGDSIYVAGARTPRSKGEGTYVFLDTLSNDVGPLNFASNIIATISPAYSLPQGVAVNTVYRGYAPASALTLTVQLPAYSYAYTWSTGATTPSITVSPVSTTTYAVTATNAYGCNATASTTVQVIDVRCGNGNDKVQVCQAAGNSDKVHSICIAPSAVATHLRNGSYLGTCTTEAPSLVMKNGKNESAAYSIRVLNSPTTNFFTLDIQSPNLVDKVTISIYDASGILRETRVLPPNNRMDLGQLYPKGVYFAEVVQGNNKQLLRLIKL